MVDELKNRSLSRVGEFGVETCIRIEQDDLLLCWITVHVDQVYSPLLLEERLERKDIFPRDGDFVGQRFLLFIGNDFQLDVPHPDSWKKITIFINQKLYFLIPFERKAEGCESVAAVSLVRIQEGQV